MIPTDAGISGRRLTRLRTLGRGASGAVVSLFAAGEGELVAVKSAPGGATAAAAQLRREGGIMASLRSPHVLPCLGFRAAAGGEEEFQLLLEFAPGGSLADAVARNGGRLEEPAVRAYAADVARGIAYLHGEEAAVVHGDVKARNVVIGADGRTMLADFGCAKRAGSSRGPIGGTPAFMAPEVARGEDQGPAADVWALGCTVIEMATGRAPWTHVDDVLAAVRLIGYTDAVPEAPEWLSAEAKDFLDKCLRRDASERWTATQLLEHPFLASAGKAEDAKPKWVSPKSTLDAAFWESEEEEEEMPESAADRIRALAGPCSALPDWESEDGWIEVCSGYSELSDAAAAAAVQEVKFPTSQCEIPSTAVATSSEQAHREVPDVPPVAAPAAETTSYELFWGDESEAELEAAELFGADSDVGNDPVHNVGAADAYAHQQQLDVHANFTSDPIVLHLDISAEEIAKTTFHGQMAPCFLLPLLPLSVL
ncbi:unnamed protein product [Miscanthus lutarioriparius]|uniref:Protein kinase domain-containing protein n=1 Tax=Miscanthus lutarioriparius TaxID=422564 RepID=A0A811RMW5_9POAL|nr:unnamed protein product [Miscanthus lutarioriparius]